FFAGSAFLGMPSPQPPWMALDLCPGPAGTTEGAVLSATIDLSWLQTGPAMVDQKIICAILPVEKPSTFSAHPYCFTFFGAYGSRSISICSAATPSSVSTWGRKSLLLGSPLINLPPIVMKRVYQS